MSLGLLGTGDLCEVASVHRPVVAHRSKSNTFGSKEQGWSIAERMPGRELGMSSVTMICEGSTAPANASATGIDLT
jgi:hypothetical protein